MYREINQILEDIYLSECILILIGKMIQMRHEIHVSITFGRFVRNSPLSVFDGISNV